MDCPQQSNAQAMSPENGPVTLNVTGWISTPAEDALVQQNLARFERLHPNIRLKWLPISGNGYDYSAKVLSNMASDNAPDVFYLESRTASYFIAHDKLLNLSPYMARDHIKASDYYSSLMAAFSCRTGQVFGIPKDWNALGLFYNKRLFREAGVAFPTSTWTWADMRAAARKLTHVRSSTPVYGISLPADSSRWLAFLFADGGSVLNADGTQAVFNDRAGVDALDFYAGFQRQDKSSILPSALVPAWDGDVLQAFGEERTAMALEGGWLIPYLTQNFSHVDYGIAPIPLAPAGKRGNLIFMNAWAAYAGTRHPEAAWELIKYMTGQEVQGSQLHAGFALPSLRSLANDAYFEQHPALKVLFDAASYGYVDVYGPDDLFIHQKLDLAIASVLSGKADAQIALDVAARQINVQLQASSP
ncbi:ABC transporter substrate-binding protein [Ktedonosporobacter rubrisoli]|uniref:ABC transporter substrate-binding protein n=1 Tax=Ktedonosporobacter rubrisoli TaxID=2509675 RepID=A0A4P6K6X9_KTERU|nr:ABC transporter substrate-binding protein [Ktedonosporobacter rubrisoli]